MATITTHIFANLPLVKCWDGSAGHMHLIQVNAEINGTDPATGDKKRYGSIGMDPAGSVVLEVEGKRYHIGGMDLWKAVYEQLKKPAAEGGGSHA